MKDNDFISQMLMETLEDTSFQKSDEFTLIKSFDDAVELQVTKDEERECFCFTLKETPIEVPVNWGPFKNRISRDFTLSRSEDTDYFLDILSDILMYRVQNIRIMITDSVQEQVQSYNQAA